MSEYRPTEYVVDFGDYRSNQFVRLSMALIEQNGAKLYERIVRCRDCLKWDYDSPYPKKACFEFSNPEDGYIVMTSPDGFCAWGERKERIEQ